MRLSEHKYIVSDLTEVIVNRSQTVLFLISMSKNRDLIVGVLKVTKLTRAEIMKRATFLRDGAKMILKFDFSDLESREDVERVITYFRSMVERMPRKSIVGLVDFNGLTVADEVVLEMISLTEFCNPYFRATAAIANEPTEISLVESVIDHFGKINLPIYQEETAAKEWLFTQ